MKEETGTIVENHHIQNEYYLIKMRADHVSKQGKPGNFIMVSASSTLEPLLKRPFGIFDLNPPYIWIYYKVVGRGTRLLSTLNPDDKISILGPLGNSFPVLENETILAIAGGTGIASVYFAIKEYLKNNKVSLIYGAKSKNDLNFLHSLETISLAGLYLYSDDGSIGIKGVVTADIKKIINQHGITITISCGPDEMLNRIFWIIKDLKTDDYASLEAIMGCGFGICQSCVVETRNKEYKQVCTDGPVFKMEEIQW
ncbi:MAG: dihydroorotate dehydrogenase electron transfer subunit [Candidatus Aminicenantes bacterium]|nr:dihydroorotate dehydrogenase electron transfer subunit [Candidatus Aminicenantes bacterium]